MKYAILNAVIKADFYCLWHFRKGYRVAYITNPQDKIEFLGVINKNNEVVKAFYDEGKNEKL